MNAELKILDACCSDDSCCSTGDDSNCCSTDTCC